MTGLDVDKCGDYFLTNATPILGEGATILVEPFKHDLDQLSDLL